MVVNIIAGSPFDMDILKKYRADITLGVDMGAYRAIEQGISVDAAFGDFDSINTYQLVKLINTCPKVNKYKMEKDQTDTEIAFDYALSLNPDVINLFGATGKRIDHFLSVLRLFYKILDKNVELFIYDEYNKIYIKQPDTYHLEKSDYPYISFFALEKQVENFSLKNFKYELSNYLLTNSDTLCVSNAFTNQVGVVTFEKGFLLIVESRD